MLSQHLKGPRSDHAHNPNVVSNHFICWIQQLTGLNATFRKCGHSSALLNVNLTFEFLECTTAPTTAAATTTTTSNSASIFFFTFFHIFFFHFLRHLLLNLFAALILTLSSMINIPYRHPHITFPLYSNNNFIHN